MGQEQLHHALTTMQHYLGQCFGKRQAVIIVDARRSWTQELNCREFASSCSDYQWHLAAVRDCPPATTLVLYLSLDYGDMPSFGREIIGIQHIWVGTTFEEQSGHLTVPVLSGKYKRHTGPFGSLAVHNDSIDL
ncbi:hypothetical protein K4F52_010350 [Lecanicillium sp. MT-2017a]|nr:hypothetical protein K4F52_010350 [Lecanicillium sp. MT-2017a]